MTLPVNPTTFTITDPTATSEGVTGFNVKFGQTPGGPYPLVAPVPPEDLATEASGVITGTLASLNEKLAPGTWYSVATALNAVGESDPSPEAAFTIEPPRPSSPTGFSVA